MSQPRFSILKKLGACLLLIALSLSPVRAANGDSSGNSQSDPAAGSNETLRAYLQLQEQLHDTQLALERNRQDAQNAAVQEAAAVSNRLAAIEQSLLTQRATELADAQRTNHLLLGAICLFAAFAFAAALLAVYFQARAVNRIADISTALSANRSLALAPNGALSLGDHEAISNGAVEQSNARLISLVQHLEKRIAELEHTTTLPLKQPAASSVDAAAAELPLPKVVDDKPVRTAKLLEEGQSHLNADRPEEAIKAFDEILALDPNHAEALVKKGSALEKMRQTQEALEYYDRAIAADDSLTIAYLHKGGLCSRLERFNEAMECYQRALHTQEKKRAA